MANPTGCVRALRDGEIECELWVREREKSVREWEVKVEERESEQGPKER